MGMGATSSANNTANAQSNIGGQLQSYGQDQLASGTAGQQQTSQYYSNILKGGNALQSAVSPQINATSRQYANAKSSVKSMPLGGLRDVSSRNLANSEASAKSSIYSGGISDALSKLSNQSNIQSQQGLSGMTGAASAYGGAGQTYTTLAQQGSQNASGWGSGIGSLIGMI